jgi:hypothetical protein
VQFGVECGLVQYENKVGTTERIHSLNLQGDNNLKGLQKPSQKDHLLINVTCVRMSTWKNRKKTWSPSLACNFRGKMGSSHLIRGVMWWKLKWCRRMWVQEKMVLKHELSESIPLHSQRVKYETNVCELEDHVGEKGWSSNWPTKLGLPKKLLQVFLITC